jgi:hypothetical protein
MKRYRRPKVYEGQIKMQMGKHYGDVDMCIFYGDSIPKWDRNLILNAICSEKLDWKQELIPSLMVELETRGYDLDTLRFSIEKKAQ